MRLISMVILLACLIVHSWPAWSHWLPGGELDRRNAELAKAQAAAKVAPVDHSGANAEYLARVPRLDL